MGCRSSSFLNMVNATFTAHSYGMLYKLLCHFVSNVSNAEVHFTNSTKCDHNSSLSSGDHSEIIEKSVTPTIRISMTFRYVGLIPGLKNVTSKFQVFPGSVWTALTHTAVNIISTIIRGLFWDFQKPFSSVFRDIFRCLSACSMYNASMLTFYISNTLQWSIITAALVQHTKTFYPVFSYYIS